VNSTVHVDGFTGVSFDHLETNMEKLIDRT